MSTMTKRTTIYFDPQIHRALRLKSAESESSISQLVDEAVRLMLLEDAEDSMAVDAVRDEPTVPFEDFVRDLQARGKL